MRSSHARHQIAAEAPLYRPQVALATPCVCPFSSRECWLMGFTKASRTPTSRYAYGPLPHLLFSHIDSFFPLSACLPTHNLHFERPYISGTRSRARPSTDSYQSSKIHDLTPHPELCPSWTPIHTYTTSFPPLKRHRSLPRSSCTSL